jgi:type IX secretion system PorP/SprF family membrane protein
MKYGHMKKTILTIGLGLSLFGASAQQDAQYSQYIFNGIYINPAYAGYKEVLNLHSFYRTQWTGVSGAPRTATLAVDAIANDGNVGLALQVVDDRLGAQENLSAYASYAYRLRLNAEGTSRLSFGLSGGLQQYGYDGSRAVTNDPDAVGAGMYRALVPDARIGVFFSNERYFAGLSADNLISSQYGDRKFLNIPKPSVHAYLTAGMLLPLSEDIRLRPSFLFKEDFNGPTSLDLNAFVLFGEKLWLGGSYRTGVRLWDKPNLDRGLSDLNSAVAAVEFFPTSAIRIGYAYDFAVGALQGNSGGTHEISLAFMFNRKGTRMATPRVF